MNEWMARSSRHPKFKNEYFPEYFSSLTNILRHFKKKILCLKQSQCVTSHNVFGSNPIIQSIILYIAQMVERMVFYKHLQFSQAYPFGNLVFKLPVLSYTQTQRVEILLITEWIKWIDCAKMFAHLYTQGFKWYPLFLSGWSSHPELIKPIPHRFGSHARLNL